jgi:glycosyltransferase involved in cell wall biosynthesis
VNEKHILFLTPWYPHKVDPMFGLFVRKQALALAGSARVGVISVLPVTHGDKFFLEEKIFNGNLPEVRVSFRKSENALCNVMRTRKAYLRGYTHYAKKYGIPHILHGNIFTRTAVVTFLLARRLNIPYVVSEHWSRYIPENFKFTGFLRKWMTRLTAQRAKAVIVPSEYLMNAMMSNGIKAHYEIVPNVIDVNLFDIAAQKPLKTKKSIVHISCFEDRSKNISGLLRAVKILSEKRKDFVLNLIGTGVDHEELKRLSAQLQVDDIVVFHGLKEDQELAEILSMASCSVLSSNYETFAIVVFESLSCGVPVVVTEVADLAKMITSETGVTVKPGDIEALANAMDFVLDKEFDPHELRDFVMERFSPGVVSGKLLKIYSQIK